MGGQEQPVGLARALALFGTRPAGSPHNVWQASVTGIELLPIGRRVALVGPLPLVVEVTAAAVAELALAPGSMVWVALKATEVQVTAT